MFPQQPSPFMISWGGGGGGGIQTETQRVSSWILMSAQPHTIRSLQDERQQLLQARRQKEGHIMIYMPLTQDQVKLGVGLKGIVQSDQEGGVSYRLQHLSLCDGVLCGLGLVHDGCFLQLLEGVQLALVRAGDLACEEDLAVGPSAQHSQQLKVFHAHATLAAHVHCNTHKAMHRLVMHGDTHRHSTGW